MSLVTAISSASCLAAIRGIMSTVRSFDIARAVLSFHRLRKIMNMHTALQVGVHFLSRLAQCANYGINPGVDPVMLQEVVFLARCRQEVLSHLPDTSRNVQKGCVAVRPHGNRFAVFG